jgi:hypothetical protein
MIAARDTPITPILHMTFKPYTPLRTSLIVVVLAALSLPSRGAAQYPLPPEREIVIQRDDVRNDESWVTVGGDLVYARPYGEFGENVKQGFGLSAHGIMGYAKSPLKLRVDVNYLNYGNKSTRSAWSSPFFGPYWIDKTTRNNIFSMSVGPQLMVPTGPFRPYVNAQVGFSRYYTETSLDGVESTLFNTTRTEANNVKLSYGGGTGVYIRLGSRSSSVMLHLGGQYLISGRTTYLTRDDIHPDESTGLITTTPRTTDVRYLTYRAGVTIAF